MYNTEFRHFEIRLTTLNKMINEWEHYKDFIVHLSMINTAEDYKNVLSRDGECTGRVELTCIWRLFSKYLLTLHC